MDDVSDDSNKLDKTIPSAEISDKKLLSISFSTEKSDENQINDLNIINSKNKQKQRYNITNKKITPNSKNKLWISLLLIILSLIFIPFYSLANTYLINLEKDIIIDSLNNFVSYDTLKSSPLKNIFNLFYILINKDFMAGYLC